MLWLFKGWPEVAANCRAAAAAQAIGPARLVLADRRPLANHLARRTHDDLLLDTFTFAAHTTAGNAL